MNAAVRILLLILPLTANAAERCQQEEGHKSFSLGYFDEAYSMLAPCIRAPDVTGETLYRLATFLAYRKQGMHLDPEKKRRVVIGLYTQSAFRGYEHGILALVRELEREAIANVGAHTLAACLRKAVEIVADSQRASARSCFEN
jgi:hypothetical protein